MDVRHKRTFFISILAISLLSPVALADTVPVALADPAEELERANDLFEKEQMMDAVVIFKKLAEQNYAPAQARLGEVLDYTEADEEAVGWYIMAAAQGSAEGAYGLGKMYLSGEGIKSDPTQALYWIKLAAEKDNLNAVKLLESSYRLGSPPSALGLAVDLQQAKLWEAKSNALYEVQKKAADERKQASLKAIFEKQEAIKKADKEAAKKVAK
ncbi:MAG: tetratricopeptide repeat protein [Gallionella sp.]